MFNESNYVNAFLCLLTSSHKKVIVERVIKIINTNKPSVWNNNKYFLVFGLNKNDTDISMSRKKCLFPHKQTVWAHM